MMSGLLACDATSAVAIGKARGGFVRSKTVKSDMDK